MSDLVTTTNTESILAEFTGGASSDVSMMIGIGNVKDSDAVYFQYVGEGQTQALMLPSGKPLTRLANVRLVGISIADNIGEFSASKLNLFIQSSQGRTLMLTAGLQTIWSQSVVNGLFAMYNAYQADQQFNLDTWKGTSKMRPCFAGIRVEGEKVADEQLKERLLELKSDHNEDGVDKLMRETIAIINSAIGGDLQPLDVKVEKPEEIF